MAEYWERMTNDFFNFCKFGDILEYIETFRKEDSECQLYAKKRNILESWIIEQ